MSEIDDHLAKFENGRTADEETDFLCAVNCKIANLDVPSLIPGSCKAWYD